MRYIKLYESIYEVAINMNLINDAKDMALEYLDEGMNLNLLVFANSCKWVDTIGIGSIWIYEVRFSHTRDISKPCNPNSKLKEDDHILYSATIYKSNILQKKETLELIRRLKRAYPNEIIHTNLHFYGNDT